MPPRGQIASKKRPIILDQLKRRKSAEASSSSEATVAALTTKVEMCAKSGDYEL
jgi:hypothetical protein